MVQKRILIFHTGGIGDTLLSLPAIQAVCRHFSSARIDLFNSALTGNYIHNTLYDNMDLFDRMYFIPTVGNFIQKILIRLRIILILFAGFYDTVVYLTYKERKIDLLLFRLLGIRHIINLSSWDRQSGNPLYLHFSRALDRYGIPNKPDQIEFNFTEDEKNHANEKFAELDIPEDQIPVLIGTGGKKQACCWPMKSYSDLIAMIRKLNCYPVFCKSPKVSEINAIIKEHGGTLFPEGSLRETILLMKKTSFYIGNDTGSAHLAAAAGIPCIVLVPGHEPLGLWKPFGEKNILIRKRIDCEFCGFSTCPKADPSLCMNSIRPEEVLKAVIEILTERNFCK